MALNEEEGDTETSIKSFQFIQEDQNHEDEVAIAEEQQQHYLPSIDLTLLIRQFPSQGISFKIWAAANTLVTLLQQHHTQPNTSPLSPLLNSLPHPPRILELGSGTGLVGIAASAILGAKVTITDLPNVLPNLQFNAAANLDVLKLNGGSVDVMSLRWGEVEDMESIGIDFDVVMGSDLVYHDTLYEPLLKTMQFFVGQERDVVFVMAHSRRWKKESGFFKKARKMFQVQTLHSEPPLPGDRIGIVVYSFARKLNNL
ncbi:hypothetical protein ACHQM5_019605 [Ranunculus cassubicifolius]